MKLNWESVAVCCMALLVAMVCGVATIANHYQTSLYTQAMKEGYSQGTVPGANGVYWVKEGQVSPAKITWHQ